MYLQLLLLHAFNFLWTGHPSPPSNHNPLASAFSINWRCTHVLKFWEMNLIGLVHLPVLGYRSLAILASYHFVNPLRSPGQLSVTIGSTWLLSGRRCGWGYFPRGGCVRHASRAWAVLITSPGEVRVRTPDSVPEVQEDPLSHILLSASRISKNASSVWLPRIPIILIILEISGLNNSLHC